MSSKSASLRSRLRNAVRPYRTATVRERTGKTRNGSFTFPASCDLLGTTPGGQGLDMLGRITAENRMAPFTAALYSGAFLLVTITSMILQKRNREPREQQTGNSRQWIPRFRWSSSQGGLKPNVT